MPIIVDITYEVWDANANSIESGFASEHEPMEFTELVDWMSKGEPSSSACLGDGREYVTREWGHDKRGFTTFRSVHYSQKNPARALKYWRLALLAAGFQLAPIQFDRRDS